MAEEIIDSTWQALTLEEIEQLDKFINEKSADGWELVTYNYMATSTQWKGAFLITFRKVKE